MLFININIVLRKQKLHMLKKKKECEKKALNIVIELVDGGLEEDDLLYKVNLYFFIKHILLLNL